MIANILIVAAVGVAFALCIRSLARGGGECSNCSSASTCAVHATGKGKCPVAEDMVRKADAALGSGSHRS